MYSQRSESNRRPIAYGAIALPTELRWRLCSSNKQKMKLCFIARSAFGFASLERQTGIEPAYLAWEANALPLCYCRFLIFIISKIFCQKLCFWTGSEEVFSLTCSEIGKATAVSPCFWRLSLSLATFSK